MKVSGVSRMFDNNKALLVSFDRPLSDDELRRFHYWVEEAVNKVSDNLTVHVGASVESPSPPLPVGSGLPLTDVFERPFDGDDDRRIRVAKAITRAEAEAILEHSGDLILALASPLILGGDKEGFMASQGTTPSPSADTGVETALLNWLSTQTNLSLEYGYPEDLDQGVWQVHCVSGGYNDREWELIAQGEDAALALYAARAALSPPEGAK